MNANFLEFKKIVEGRRSIRQFTSEKVPSDVIESCLDLALLAPNSSNLQAWEFYWVQNAEKKQKLAEFCFNQKAASTASDLIAVVARPDLWSRGQKINLDYFNQQNSTPHIEQVKRYYLKTVPLAYQTDFFGFLKVVKTVVAWAVGLFKVSYRGPFGHSGNLLWATKTTSLAAENLMLAIHASGFDSCPMEGFDQTRVKKLLQLPGAASVVMIIGLGRAAEGGLYGPRIRGPRDWFIQKI